MASTSHGTSTRINITGEDFTQSRRMKLSPIDNSGITAVPPVPDGEMPSQEMYDSVNRFRDFAFPKICPPMYGNDNSIARTTGLPANKPDYIADHHFIALMRIIDDFLVHKYSAYIDGTYDSPTPRK